jgi:hypothetical protein
LQSIFPQWAQDLNTGLGIVGFLITCYVMYEVASIRKSFRSRARLPEIVKNLQTAGSSLNGILADWPMRKDDARVPIKNATHLLGAAMFLVKGDAKGSVRRLRKKLNTLARDFSDVKYDDPAQAWDIYSDIQASITLLSQTVSDQKWN